MLPTPDTQTEPRTTPYDGGITLHGILAAAFFVAGTITLVAPVPPLTLSGPAGWFTAGLLCIVTDRLTRLLNLAIRHTAGQ